MSASRILAEQSGRLRALFHQTQPVAMPLGVTAGHRRPEPPSLRELAEQLGKLLDESAAHRRLVADQLRTTPRTPKPPSWTPVFGSADAADWADARLAKVAKVRNDEEPF